MNKRSSQIRLICPRRDVLVVSRTTLRDARHSRADLRSAWAICWVDFPLTMAARRVFRLAWYSDRRFCAALRSFREIARERLVEARSCSACEAAFIAFNDCFWSMMRLLICEVNRSRVDKAS